MQLVDDVCDLLICDEGHRLRCSAALDRNALKQCLFVSSMVGREMPPGRIMNLQFVVRFLFMDSFGHIQQQFWLMKACHGGQIGRQHAD